MGEQLLNELVWPGVYILCSAVPRILAVAMFVYWERKVIGWMHVRMGPNKVGPWGLLQAFADVVKLLIKEVILPSSANRFLYYLAPCWHWCRRLPPGRWCRLTIAWCW